MTQPHLPGVLVLVVGPSGAGKDSLLRYAAEALAGHAGFVFPRRTITRPHDGGTEMHQSIGEAEFDHAERAGQFALSWQAHGLRYGIPASIMSDLAQGRSVVINVSRAVIAETHRRFHRILVVNVTAPEHIRATRLAGRGRETASDIAGRLARKGDDFPPGVDVVTIDNDSTLEWAGDRLVAHLRAVLENSRAAAL